MADEAQADAGHGRVEVDDTYLGGKRPGGKTPVIAAVETTPERKPRRLKLTKGFRKSSKSATSPPAAP